jgi:hypothetical protein
MPYSKFSLEEVKSKFELEIVDINFLSLNELLPTERLVADLKESDFFPIESEKARSEFLIAPILRDIARQKNYSFKIFSGENLDVEPEKSLNGECDFILSKSKERYLKVPVFAVVEAKREKVSSALGQVVAQMVGADILNNRNGNGVNTVFGAVTTGEIWQFLKLHNGKVEIELRRFYISDINKILGAISEIVDFYREK